ncbi:ankyrin [Polychaeton citri CBS 116435]|uniref:Ankyrin n=1 Tax=Polychaeton citri CBS 116435 TaxID=1314669 RepID=A0A9P4Q392_9PEZI|nr:ankyrin [Polychaeton citri CBS 116435]
MSPPSLYEAGLSQFVADAKKTYVKEGDAEGQRQLAVFLQQRGTPQGAHSYAIALEAEAGKKYGSVKVHDKVIISKTWIDNVIGNIGNVIAAGNTLMNSAPETVSAAWFMVTLGLRAIQSDYSLYNLFGSGLTTMTEMMVLIPHYDTLFDKRDKSGYQPDEMTQMLFQDIVNCYAAVLDFMFSIQRHIEGSRTAKLRHAFSDFFGGEERKFQGKQDTVVRLKLKVLESSEAAFKSKVFDQMGDIQESLKNNLESMDLRHKEILGSLQDLKASLKPKTRWDWLKQDFESHVKLLDPYQGNFGLVIGLLGKKQHGTCTWIFDDETYAAWSSGTSDGLLCIAGPEGVGKSIIAATILENLEEDLASDNTLICHFSCTTKDNNLADLGDDPAQKVRSTLLYHFYKTLAEDKYGEAPELLEEANKLFRPPKMTDKQRSTTAIGSEPATPPFVATMVRLAKITKLDFVLVVDSLDRLARKDQLQLFEDFSVLVSDRENRCRVIAICRTGQPLYAQAQNKYPILGIEGKNDDDIGKVLDEALLSQQGLTPQERQEAKRKVIEMAGGSFAYVTDHAIPFLRQPFQRPLSNRLKTLPRGILDTYKQALKIQEIMEAHSGIYLTDVDMGADEDYQQSVVSKLEVEQLEEASGPFLRNWRNAGGHWYSSPKDIVQIRKFCNSAAEPTNHVHDHALCASCGKDVSNEGQLMLTEKDVHLRVAITLLRHLNNRLFQKRHDIDEPDDQISVHEEPEPIPDQPKEKEQVSEMLDELETTREQHLNADTGEVEAQPKADAQAQVDVAKTDTSNIENDSSDSEDGGDVFIQNNEPPSAVQQMIDDNTWTLRYEIERWPFHVREAERLWSYGEKQQNPQWQELLALLDRFALDTPKVFRAWCSMFNYTQPENKLSGESALNVAACLGLEYWAEHLIKQRELDANVVDQGVTPLLALRPAARNREILKFFLQQPGIDRDILNGSDVWNKPVVHRWLEEDGSIETVKILLEAGADLATPVGEDRFTAMHALAWSIEDSETLDLALSASGNPNINASAANGNTPLHILLSRSDMKVEVVQAYLDKGANVDAENNLSVRPLDQACWNCRPDIIVKLLEHGVADINDGDDDDFTALHSSCVARDIECVRALLKHEANVHVKTTQGRTPLHSAAQDSTPGIVRELIENGADPTTRDANGRTPFWCACDAKDGSEKAEILLNILEQKFTIQEINVPSIGNRTPLRSAATRGYVDIVTKLIDMTSDAGLNVPEMLDIQDTRHRNTALHRASIRGEHACVKVLLEHGANATLRNDDRKTAMELASALWQALGTAKYEQVVLLCASKDLERIKLDIDLPAIAATNGSVKVLEELANLGVNLNNADSFGWTPLLLAQRLKMTEVERFLKSHTAWKFNLPSSWIKHSGVPDAFKIDQDGTSFTYTLSDRVCLTTDRPLPGNLDRYYYEVSIKRPNSGEDIFPDTPKFAIGFGSLGGIAYVFPGWEAKKGVRNGHSWAYHGDDGWLPSSQDHDNPHVFDEKFGPNDVVGAGIDLSTQTMWFTKNGKKLDFQHSDVNGRLFPLLGMIDNVSVETNFGSREFEWKGYLENADASNEHVNAVRTQIEKTSERLKEVEIGAQQGEL